MQKTNDPKSISKFEEHILELLISQRDSKATTLPTDVLDHSKQHADLAFSKDFFIHQIEQFFSSELSIVIQPTDDEYQKHISQY